MYVAAEGASPTPVTGFEPHSSPSGVFPHTISMGFNYSSWTGIKTTRQSARKTPSHHQWALNLPVPVPVLVMGVWFFFQS